MIGGFSNLMSLIIVLVGVCNSASTNPPKDKNAETFVRKMSTINHFVYISIKTEFSRSQIAKMVQNYGCHCFPRDSKSVTGMGGHVDELDYVCKQLGNCHKCVNIEFPGECSTDFGKYKYSGGALSGGDGNAEWRTG